MNKTVLTSLTILYLLSIMSATSLKVSVEAQQNSKAVLFDMLHVEQFALNSYSGLVERLKDWGYVSYQIGRHQDDVGYISYESLEKIDVFVLGNPQIEHFTDSEIQAIHEFVQKGGGLLVLDGTHPVEESSYPVKGVIEFFGIEYELPKVRLGSHITDIVSHPIMQNVTHLCTIEGFLELNVSSAAEYVAFSGGKPVIAISEYENGRVVVISAGYIFANDYIGKYDNSLLARNAFEWLAEFGSGTHEILPLVDIVSWNPPSTMFINASYQVIIELFNAGSEPIDVEVTIPTSTIFNNSHASGKRTYGLVGDTKSVNIPTGTNKSVDLTVKAQFSGHLYMSTYVYIQFYSSYLVCDLKSTSWKLVMPIEILSPQNITYITSFVPLTLTVDDSISWMGYSLDGQQNVTIVGNTTLTDLSSGSHNITFYANDALSNMGMGIVYFTVDTTKPNITNVSQDPLTNVLPDTIVKINATVTDATSGIKQALLNCTFTNSTSTWYTVFSMAHLTGDIWNATIPPYPYGTNVTYVIIAEDNASNTITTEQIYGYKYEYQVVPEFPSFLIMPLFMIATLLAVIVYKRKHQTRNKKREV